MDIIVAPGKYVVAVSGGVDSAVLLDVLVQQPNLQLVVAHFDHGIRADSPLDRQLVATLSQEYGLAFEYTEGKLGASVSEEQARQARYEFLQQVRRKHEASAVITAHHQDDALETMVFNVLRGTKRKGMSSLQSTDDIIRPLMGYDKETIRQYANEHNLQWREDSTNKDEKYTRNWIRRKLLPKLSRKQKQHLQEQYEVAKDRNAMVDTVVNQQLEELRTGSGISRRNFIALPHSVACEVMARWLREGGVSEIDRKLIDVLVVAAKTLPPGKKVNVGKQLWLVIEGDDLRLT